jgi:hypothetical protein
LFLSDQDVFGYEAVPRMEIDTNWASSGEPLRYMRNGMYAVARFNTLPDVPMLACDAYDYITLQRLAWRNTDTGEGGLIISHTPVAPVLYRDVTGHDREGERASQYIYMFDFMLAFMNEGHYELTFEMYTTSGNMWTRRCDLLVEDASHNIIDLYRVEQLDLADRINMSITTPEVKAHMDIWMDAFQMVHPDPDTQGWEVPGPLFPPTDEEGNYPHTDMGDIVYIPYKEHSMFVMPENGKPIGRMNHTVIMNIYKSQSITYEITGIHGTKTLTSGDIGTDPIGWFNTNFPEYIWVTNIIPNPPNPLNPADPWNTDWWRVLGI